MSIPVWAIAVGAIVLYFLIGIAFAMIAAYRDGRGSCDMFALFGGVAWTIFWPFVTMFSLCFFMVDKYASFLEKVRERGRESVMPPKNESPGRRVS
jgi:hypothetical protein